MDGKGKIFTLQSGGSTGDIITRSLDIKGEETAMKCGKNCDNWDIGTRRNR